jgi:uncharacterized membrane protein YqiK
VGVPDNVTVENEVPEVVSPDGIPLIVQLVAFVAEKLDE